MTISELTHFEKSYLEQSGITFLDHRYYKNYETGLVIQYAHVPDESDSSPTKKHRQELIAQAQDVLEHHPAWQEPTTHPDGTVQINNEISEWIYESPGMTSWRKMVPNAIALYPMQRPDIAHFPKQFGDNLEIDDDARSFFLDARDSIGIRTRARIMTYIAQKNIRPEVISKWVSLACGAAVPVLDSLESVNQANIHAELSLVDINREALDFACELAEEKGLKKYEDFTPIEADLIKNLILGDGLIEQIGEETAQMVDAMGIFEYFKDRHATMFLRQAFRLVQPGGTIVIANMLSTREELDFNQRGIGWPKIYPRSIAEITELIDGAGIGLENVTITIPEDGVYAVVEIKKAVDAVIIQFPGSVSSDA